jgi:methylmalonyl-CoA mutase N-terminal domain/subunit
VQETDDHHVRRRRSRRSVDPGAWPTRSGFVLDELMTAEHVADLAIGDGAAGVPPFTRGIARDGYRNRPWIIGQYAGFGSAEEANRRYRQLIAQGQTGLSLALDLPTQMGFDSDHPLARGEVGRVGVAIDSLADMEVLFDGISLEQVRQLRTTANAIGPIWLALVVALGEHQGFDAGQLAIFIQNDILKEYVARGTYILPPRPAVELVADTIEYCAAHLPAWTPLAMSGYHIRESGSDCVQELAFTFANGIAYCEAAMARGVDPATFLPSLFTFLSAGTDLLEEIAKFRAARTVWSAVVRDRLGTDDEQSQALRIFAFSAGSNLTAQQPLNNVVRVAVSALAATLGGAQTLHTSGFDEALALPTEDAARLAVRTQQILLEEVGLRSTTDPLGGAWALERLTADIVHDVEVELDRIDELGGAVACVESGWYRDELADAAYEDQRSVESGDRRIVGVNVHRSEGDEPQPEIFRVDPAAEAKQVSRLAEVRRRRSASAVRAALDDVGSAATGGDNVVPAMIAAVHAYATIGEICDVLRQVHGSFDQRQVA